MNQLLAGKFITQKRKEKNLTQEQLAEKIGVSNKTISKWETGTTVPSSEKLIRLSKLYSVSLDVLTNDVIELAESKGTISGISCEKKRSFPRAIVAAVLAVCVLVGGVAYLSAERTSEKDEMPPAQVVVSDKRLVP